MRMKKRFETLKELLETRKIHGGSNLGQRKNERTALVRDPCHHKEVPLLVMQRAEAVQENLDANFPSFVKPMIRSNVTKGFWLSLPKVFCHLHMPSQDTTIILEDEFRRQYRTRYLAERRGLSAGWMGFSIAHNLAEGDALVFHLVRYNKLKVYIIRSSKLDEVDAALCLMHLDVYANQTGSGQRRIDFRGLEPAGEKHLKSVSENISCNILPKDNIVQVINHPEKICWDLELALEGLISKTSCIANAVARNFASFSNDFAAPSEWMNDYEQIRSHLGRIHAQLDQLLCLVLEPKPFYCKGYRGVVYIPDGKTDIRNTEVKMVRLKETVERLYWDIEGLKDTC